MQENEVKLPRLNGKPVAASANERRESPDNQDDEQRFSTIIPQDVLIPSFKKKTLNPIKIKDIYLSKKREQLFREMDVKRRYQQHKSLTKERLSLDPEQLSLPPVIKNGSFFKLNEKLKFNYRFTSLHK